jgi:16S rRNA (adenine1518-N6/adenine1519-N6)-dimethyltransferase
MFKVFEERGVVQDLTIMVQREVARRIVAEPGTKAYGILSVFSRFYSTPTLLFNVSPNCFYPKPGVTSTVVQFKIREQPLYSVDENLFRTVVRTTFGKRRKTLRNSLKYLPYNEDVLRRILDNRIKSLERRPEQLSTEDFVELSKSIELSLV